MCDTCDTGYKIELNKCVPEFKDCGTGIVVIVNTEPKCDCPDGYHGDKCEFCSPGYGRSGDTCVLCSYFSMNHLISDAWQCAANICPAGQGEFLVDMQDGYTINQVCADCAEDFVSPEEDGQCHRCDSQFKQKPNDENTACICEANYYAHITVSNVDVTTPGKHCFPISDCSGEWVTAGTQRHYERTCNIFPNGNFVYEEEEECEPGYEPGYSMIAGAASFEGPSFTSKICEPIQCADATVDHSDYAETALPLGSPTIVTCDPGYDPGSGHPGGQPAVCGVSGWSKPTCESRNCPAIDNSAIDNTNIIGVTLGLACDNGYSSTDSTVTCKAPTVQGGDPSWDNAPCLIQSCSSSVDNGQIDDVQFQVTSSLLCNNGYSAKEATYTCVASGTGVQFDSTPECVEERCDNILIPKSNRTEGTGTPKWKTEGEVSYTCHPGYGIDEGDGIAGEQRGVAVCTVTEDGTVAFEDPAPCIIRVCTMDRPHATAQDAEFGNSSTVNCATGFTNSGTRNGATQKELRCDIFDDNVQFEPWECQDVVMCDTGCKHDVYEDGVCSEGGNTRTCTCAAGYQIDGEDATQSVLSDNQVFAGCSRLGCMDVIATNYDDRANIESGNCVYRCAIEVSY